MFASAPHVVVLGAGATKACLDEFGGDAGGRASPLMDEIPDVVPGVADLLKEAKEAGAEISANFETTYAGIRSSGPLDDLADRLEAAVREYFSGLRIPESATIYDHLCLALRPKDLIASFNWDPLLEQARRRQAEIAGFDAGPRIVYLHGNTEMFRCDSCGLDSPTPTACDHCDGEVRASSLLFPSPSKDYSDHAKQWKAFSTALSEAKMFTVFGYSAPATDAEAVGLLREAWGNLDVKYTEWLEIIGRPGAGTAGMERSRETWKEFIPFVTHVTQLESFYECTIAEYPRRTIEHWSDVHVHGRFTEFEPVPQRKDRYATHAWYEELMQFEDAPASESE